MRIFLSYGSRDRAIAETFVAALKATRPTLEIFYDQRELIVGGFWIPQLHQEIEKADAFVFLFGERLGPWQCLEYYGALDRRAKTPTLPIAPVLIGGAGVPGLPFFNQLHWISSESGAAPDTIARILGVFDDGDGEPPKKLWSLVNPYRGLQALREEDAAFLHGRETLLRRLLDHLASPSRKLTIAVGNSGVGKSSLIYAGVFASLARQGWIGQNQGQPWPSSLGGSRRWLKLSFKPGEQPLRELARRFVAQWRDPKSPQFYTDVDGWTARLWEGQNPIEDLVGASDQWAYEQGLPLPQRYVLYVDQAEELYVRAERKSAARLSEILRRASESDRLRVLMSLRADFYGKLQDDAALFTASERIDIPKLDEGGFHAVVTGPAKLLEARFEEGLADELVKAAIAEPIGLPLLAYQLTEIWRAMVGEGEGVLRWPKRHDPSFDLASALVENADGYLSAHPEREDALRRLFCARLIHVPEQGAPTRRVALQSELSPVELQVAQDLSSPDYRLLAAGETDEGKPSLEVGHEAILSAWERLKNWIADRRGFYAWLSRIEGDRRDWERQGKPNDALLAGRALEIARGYRATFGPDIRAAESAFIVASEVASSRVVRRAFTGQLILAAAVLVLVAGGVRRLNCL